MSHMARPCWICRDDGSTREHFFKASDVRSLFGRQSKLFVSRASRVSIVQGAKSEKLCFKEFICAKCNNQITQPHDKAWETLSERLNSIGSLPSAGQSTRVASTPAELLGVHLYFAKLFGCRIVDEAIPIDGAPILNAILRGVEYPYLWLSFWCFQRPIGERMLSQSKVTAHSKRGVVGFAWWTYALQRVGVSVFLAKSTHTHLLPRYAWRPGSAGDSFYLCGV